MALTFTRSPPRIPRLKTAVSHLLATCLAALARLPPRSEAADSTAELIQLVFRFCEAVKETVDGTGDDKSFVHRSRAHYRALKAALRATAPDFRPFEDPHGYPRPLDPLSQRREDEFSALASGSGPILELELVPEPASPMSTPAPVSVPMPMPGAPVSVPMPMPGAPVPVWPGMSSVFTFPTPDAAASRAATCSPARSDSEPGSRNSLRPATEGEGERVEFGGGAVMGLLDVRRVIKE